MSMQAGDVLAGRYRLDDLLAESGAGRFWRAHDLVLHRPVPPPQNRLKVAIAAGERSYR